MRILVTAASKHGSTMEIAGLIAEVLNSRGVSADAKPIGLVSTVEPYDAVVLGSAIYFGRWLTAAVEFADTFLDDLARRPVWLFSSGPVRDADPHADEADASPLTGIIVPRDHRVFLGALDRDDLGFAERSIVHLVRAGYGDFRDWREISAWANSIADSLSEEEGAET